MGIAASEGAGLSEADGGVRPALLALLVTGCAHLPAFMGPMCEPDPRVNDQLPADCIDVGSDGWRVCYWPDAFEGEYRLRESCYAEWTDV